MVMTTSILFPLITFMTVTGSLVSEVDDCPNQRCFCFADEDLECTELFLDRVPQFVRSPRNLTYQELDLSKNRIRRIGPRSFENVSIRSIKMWSNKKKINMTIHSRAFQGLSHCLEKISFRKNMIPSLPSGLFRHLERLSTLDLKENKIEVLSKGVFKGARNISVLHLDQNRFQILKEFAFMGLRNLKELTLAHNHIHSIESKSFHGLRNLEFLDLRHNRIRDIQPKTFVRLVNLKKLDLSHNIIPALFPLMFKGLRQLEVMLLTNNHIVMVAKETFSTMESLEELRLEKNKLSFLNAGVFEGLYNLRSLYLHHNILRSIPDRLFHGLSSLFKIHLEYNELNHLNACSFEYLDWEGGVWLTGNPIHCDCMMAWTAILKNLRIYGKCKSPPTTSGQEIQQKDKYDVCRSFGGDDCRISNGQIPRRRKSKNSFRMKYDAILEDEIPRWKNSRRNRLANDVAKLTKNYYKHKV